MFFVSNLPSSSQAGSHPLGIEEREPASGNIGQAALAVMVKSVWEATWNLQLADRAGRGALRIPPSPPGFTLNQTDTN